MRWPGAGGNPSPSPSGLEDGKVLMVGGVQSDMALSPPSAQGGWGEKVEVTVFSFENQSCYSRGVEVVMPTDPGHQGPSGWAGGVCPHRG